MVCIFLGSENLTGKKINVQILQSNVNGSFIPLLALNSWSLQDLNSTKTLFWEDSP